MKTPEPKGIDKSKDRTFDDLTNEAKNYKMEKVIMGQFGIEETKDVVLAVTAFANAVSSALEDDKISLGDLPLLIGVATKLPSAISGISEVPKELNELDEAEKNELLVLVQEELDFQGDVEEVVTKALIIISDIKDLVDLIGSLQEPTV